MVNSTSREYTPSRVGSGPCTQSVHWFVSTSHAPVLEAHGSSAARSEVRRDWKRSLVTSAPRVAPVHSNAVRASHTCTLDRALYRTYAANANASSRGSIHSTLPHRTKATKPQWYRRQCMRWHERCNADRVVPSLALSRYHVQLLLSDEHRCISQRSNRIESGVSDSERDEGTTNGYS